MRRDRAQQIRMAADIKLFAGQQFVHVGIAARAQEVVTSRAVRVNAIVHAIASYGCDRPQVRQAGPESIEDAHVRALQLLCPRRPEALARIVEIPRVEVDYLRSLYRNDATDLAGHDGQGVPRSHGEDNAIDERACLFLAADATVECRIRN